MVGIYPSQGRVFTDRVETQLNAPERSVPMTFAIPIFPLGRLEFLAAELPTSSEFPSLPSLPPRFNTREQQSQASFPRGSSAASSLLLAALVNRKSVANVVIHRGYVFQRFRKRLARVLS